MSTAVWPPIDATKLASEQTESQQRELEWLLVQLRETLQSLKSGLEECAALLAPTENGSTLVLTSVRSESLKGLITRVGTRIIKGVCYSHPYACEDTLLMNIRRTLDCELQVYLHRVDHKPTMSPSPQHPLLLHLSCRSSHQYAHRSTAASML